MLAARLPGIPPATTPGTARSADAGGCLIPSRPLWEGRYVGPYPVGRSCMSKNARGNAGSARGGEAAGVPYGGQPGAGPDRQMPGGLPYPRNRLTSPGIKAAPLALLLDRIVRNDESGAEAAVRIFRRFRRRGCRVVRRPGVLLNGSPDVQDILIALAGWMAEREPARHRERIEAGLARRRAEGKAAGRQAGPTGNGKRRRPGSVRSREEGGARRAAGHR